MSLDVQSCSLHSERRDETWNCDLRRRKHALQVWQGTALAEAYLFVLVPALKRHGGRLLHTPAPGAIVSGRAGWCFSMLAYSIGCRLLVGQKCSWICGCWLEFPAMQNGFTGMY